MIFKSCHSKVLSYCDEMFQGRIIDLNAYVFIFAHAPMPLILKFPFALA